ncbi:MAG: dihydrofolate reductase family protein [Bacteroidetes bacterium]|nr:dihydrofolate reductase family protein [Bacteroidota bacterium]
MKNKNYVFIARSIDGYIADKNGDIDWLYTVANTENSDCGYEKFINKIDAIIMGRSSFEKVLSFGIDWPYNIPVLVLSNTLKKIPKGYIGKVEIISGTPKEILKTAHTKGYKHLYIDGGKTVQGFLNQDLIDEICITTIPILLGEGIPLFKELPEKIRFEHIKTEVYLNELVQSNYRRKR